MKYSKLRGGVAAESLADQVYTLLQRMIARGEFKPGERILEKKLAQALRISRTPVREALLRLEADGLVLCNSRRSYNVRVLTVADVKEIYDTVGMLEGAVVSAVASRITSEDLRLLREYNAEMEHAAASGNLQAFGQWNRKFHGVFLSKFENRTVREICDSVRRRLYAFPVRRSSLAEWLKKSVREHREIIRLAAAKDAQGLGTYFRDVHWSFEKNRRYIEDAFDRNGEAAIHF